MILANYQPAKEIAAEAIADWLNIRNRVVKVFKSDEEQCEFFKLRWVHRTAQEMELTNYSLLFPLYSSRDNVAELNEYRISVDPKAMKIAEDVLSVRHGKWQPRKTNEFGENFTEYIEELKYTREIPRKTGGFDSMGCYGLNASTITQCWYAAGCKDTPKFRLQIARLGMRDRVDYSQEFVAKKGDSVPFLRNFYRGLTWLGGNKDNLSRNAVAALGRISPDARRCALIGVMRQKSRNNGSPTIRVRDLNWAAVRSMEENKRNNPHPRVLAAYSSPRNVDQFFYREDWETLLTKEDQHFWYVKNLTPQYREISVDQSRRIVLGETPVQLSGGVLNKEEAHTWLSSDETEAEYMINIVNSRMRQLTGLGVHFRSIPIARWFETLLNSNRRESLTRKRTAQLPGGEVREFSLIDILDEVQDSDIVTGKDAVIDVLNRVHERFGEHFLNEAMKDHRQLVSKPSWALKLPKFVSLLNTPHQLAKEGDAMKHCVGGYVQSVEKGQCHILHIETRFGGSTVELSPDLNVVQHKAEHNCTPSHRNQIVLNAVIRRIKGVK